MTREKHKLSGYFLILEEKSNKYNNYAVYQECVRGLGRKEAIKQRFTNTKHTCAKHLENCPYWAERHSSEKTQVIIQKAIEYGLKKPIKRQRLSIDNNFDEGKTEVLTPLSNTSTPSQGSSNLNNFFYKSSHANSISSISADISFQSFGPLDNYMYHELKPEQIETFEHLLLDVTVACGFAFCWIDNLAVKELFKWLNPMLELPDHKQLSGRILKKASNNLKDIVFNDAINYGLCFRKCCCKSKVWLGRLQNKQAAIYKVHTPATTRWNSYYYCFASLLKTKGALRVYEKIISDGYDFPEKHLQCILDNNWWISIKKIETFLISYCAILNKLQRQNSRLHKVLHGFGNVVMTLKNI
ncbi:unnamed protein product [Rhizophagus irregularis]|nr:unnamed protein product [Rhizophagus irregularis]